MTRLPPPRAEELPGGRWVVRDDELVGGSKVRFLLPLLENLEPGEYVYAGPCYGYAQIALAEVCRMLGYSATVFVAMRTEPHPRTMMARRLGAKVVQVPHGYLSNVQAKANAYCNATGARMLPFGVNTPEAIGYLAHAVRTADLPRPTEVWCVAGSGTLTRALQVAWPSADHHAVRVGGKPAVGRALLHEAPERFEQPAQRPPPFPSADNYDAKAWRFFDELAKPGALLWNVGA